MAPYNELKRKAHLLSTIISEIKTQASAVTVQIKDVIQVSYQSDRGMVRYFEKW